MYSFVWRCVKSPMFLCQRDLFTPFIWTCVNAPVYTSGQKGLAAPVDPGVCSLVNCLLHCPYGRKTDDNGCELCQCNDPPRCVWTQLLSL